MVAIAYINRLLAYKMCSVKRHHLYDPRETQASNMMRLSAAVIAITALVVVETHAAPVLPAASVSPTSRHVLNDRGNDVLTAVDQFESLVRSAVTKLSSGPSKQNTVDLGGRGLLEAKPAEVTSPRPTDMKNGRSSAGGIRKMMSRVIGKFNLDSHHRTSIVPTSINGATT